MHSVLIECVVKGDVRADQGNVCTVYARLGGSVFDVLSQSVPCITTHVQFSSLFCDWSKHPSNNAAVAWLIAATVLVHVGVCFIQRNINNEPFWTRLYRGGDKILVGLKTDSPRRALTVLDIYWMSIKVWRSSISTPLWAWSLSRSRDWRVDTIRIKEKDNSKSCTLLLEWLLTCKPRYRD